MPTTEYPKNPNVDTAFVTDDNNKRNRALKTVLVDGTIDYPSNSNSTGCYVTIDGKKQRAMMTADISSAGTLEYPENSNSTKGYVDINGKKQRVILTAAIAGGGTPINNQDISVTENGTYTADEGYTGLGTVEVNVPNPSTGTMYIISNGTYNVADKAIANVQVPTTAPAYYVEKTVDANGKLQNSTNIINFDGVTDVGTSVLSYAYYAVNFPANTSVDLSNLTTISGNMACQQMFYGCTGLTSADLSGLTTISGSSACASMFYDCTGLTSADLSGLTTISGGNACYGMFINTGLTSVNLSGLTTISGGSACSGMLQNCTGLTSVNLSGLTTISGGSACSGMFQNCTGITSVDLSSLTTISGSSACSSMLRGCTSLTTVYIGGTTAIDFGTRTNQFSNIFQGCAQNIDVYAPAASQSAIEGLTGYPNFGGTGTVTWHWRS